MCFWKLGRLFGFSTEQDLHVFLAAEKGEFLHVHYSGSVVEKAAPVKMLSSMRALHNLTVLFFCQPIHTVSKDAFPLPGTL